MNTSRNNPVKLPTPPALEARNLALAWDDGVPVVADVNLSVGVGETVCLVGRSGTGKTTLLHGLAGLLRPAAGHVFIHGRDTSAVPGAVGYMLQKDLLLDNLRIVDNTCLPLLIAGQGRREARQLAMDVLDEFGLAAYAQKWPHELSGGMRQRVAFARTCMQGSDVVLLDEPFSALDAITRVEVRAWFKDLAAARNLSVLMITHDAHEACVMGDRIFALSPEKPSTIAGVVTMAGAEAVPVSDAVQRIVELIGA